MYFPYFLTYIIVGFAITLVVFFWALRNGQFRDQQRARYLPLDTDLESGDVKVSKMGRYETYVLFFLAVAGLAASGAVLVFALIYGRAPGAGG